MDVTTTTTEAPVYERVLQIDASPETVWEFLVDPEKVARWKGLPATAFDASPLVGSSIERTSRLCAGRPFFPAPGRQHAQRRDRDSPRRHAGPDQ